MASRLLTLAPLAPAFAVIAFAAAHAAAQSIAPSQNRLEDVQVGEAGDLLRVALICRKDCNVFARAGGVFYLQGVEASLNVDLKKRASLARALEFVPSGGGTTLTVDADEVPQKASIKPCRIDGSAASCIDLEFAETARQEKSRPVAAAEPIRAPSPAQKPAHLETPPASPPQNTTTQVETPAPSLREAPEASLLTFARFAPPERLAPPSEASLTVHGQDGKPAIQLPAGAGRPRIIDKARAEELINSKADFAENATDILSRSFNTQECAVADGKLKTDAWNLEAMVDVGFCTAIAGDLERADDLFSRLLAYTPDNYEALVGRALIAAKAGEKSVARKYFQDALNAAPPMAASGRIVEAMSNL